MSLSGFLPKYLKKRTVENKLEMLTFVCLIYSLSSEVLKFRMPLVVCCFLLLLSLHLFTSENPASNRRDARWTPTQTTPKQNKNKTPQKNRRLTYRHDDLQLSLPLPICNPPRLVESTPSLSSLEMVLGPKLPTRSSKSLKPTMFQFSGSRLMPLVSLPERSTQSLSSRSLSAL